MGTSKLKVLLTENDIRIKDLSAASGIPYKTCQAIASGRRPTIDHAYRISEALGLHIDRVFPDLYEYSTLQRNRRKKAK